MNNPTFKTIAAIILSAALITFIIVKLSENTEVCSGVLGLFGISASIFCGWLIFKLYLK